MPDWGSWTDLSGFAGDVVGQGEPSSVPVDIGGGAIDYSQMGPGATPEPSGLSAFASKLGGEFTKSPLEAFTKSLGLAGTGLGVYSQLSTANQLARQTALQEKGQKSAQAAAAPAVEFGRRQLETASAGKLDPALEATVTQWVQQKKAEMRQTLASMGLGQSTDIKTLDDQIDLMGQTMRGQLIQGQEQVGLQGLETGVSAGTGTAATAGNQQALLANLIQSANAQLAQLGGAAK